MIKREALPAPVANNGIQHQSHDRGQLEILRKKNAGRSTNRAHQEDLLLLPQHQFLIIEPMIDGSDLLPIPVIDHKKHDLGDGFLIEDGMNQGPGGFVQNPKRKKGIKGETHAIKGFRVKRCQESIKNHLPPSLFLKGCLSILCIIFRKKAYSTNISQKNLHQLDNSFCIF